MTPTKDQRSISSIHFSFLLSKFQLYPPSSPFLRSLCLFAAKTPRFRKPRKTRNFTKPKTPTKVSAPYFQIPLSVFLCALPASAFRFIFQISAFYFPNFSFTPSSPFLRSLCLFAAKTLRSREPRKTRKTRNQRRRLKSALHLFHALENDH